METNADSYRRRVTCNWKRHDAAAAPTTDGSEPAHAHSTSEWNSATAFHSTPTT